MIIQLLLSVIVGVIKTAISLMPQVAIPDWVVSAGDAVRTVMASAGGFAYWVPLALGVKVAATVMAVLAAGFLIRVGRMILSFFTGGGGS